MNESEPDPTRRASNEDASDGSATPVADRARARPVQARHRFHANDNISAFLEEGELEALHAEVERKLRGVLPALVIDTEHDHNTHHTVRRVARCSSRKCSPDRTRVAPGSF